MDGEGKIQRERLEGAAQHLSLYFKIQHRHSDHMITYFLGCFAQFRFFSYLDSSLRIHPYLFLCLIDRFASAYFHIFQNWLYCIWTGDLFKFHLPFSAVLMGNVLMQGDLTLEASHFPPRLCQVNSLIKKWNNIMKTVIVK